VAGRIRLIEESSELIGNQTHNLPACNIVSQQTMLLHAPSVDKSQNLIHDVVMMDLQDVDGG
jgi:hypothetical protein